MSKLNLTILLSAVDKLTAPLKGVQKQLEKLQGDTKNASDALAKLRLQKKNVETFKKLSGEISQSNQKIIEAREKAKQLQRQLNNTANPTQKLKKQVANAFKEVHKLTEAQVNQRKKLNKLRQSLIEGGFDTAKFKHSQAQLKQKIEQSTAALNKQDAAMKRLQARQSQQQKYQKQVETLKNASDKTKEFGQRSMVMGGAVLGTGAAMMKPAVEFEQAFSKVQALTRLDKNNAADAAKIKALRDQAINLGATTSFTSTDVAAGQSYLAMAGFNQEQITQSMPAILNMTKAADMDMGRVSDISSDILSGFGKKAEEMNHIADVLTLTFTSSNVNLEMLGESMKYVGPLAAKTGQSFESMAAMVGLLGNVGIKGSQSGTALRAMLNRLSGPTKAATKQLNKLGVKTKDAKGNLRALPDILADIAKKTKKMGSADQLAILKDIFGEEAATAAAELIKQAGEKNIREFDKKLKEANGTAQKVAETMSDNLMGDLKGLDSAREALGITIFDGQSNALRELTQTATSWLRTVNEWIKANPELTSKIIRWMAILASAATVIGALSIASSFTLYPLARMGLGFLKVGGIVLSLGGKFLGLIRAISLLAMANPIILAIAAVVVALAGVAYLIYKNWEPLSKWFKEIWDQVKVKFDEVKKWFSDLSSDFLKFGEDMIASLKKGIEDKFKAVTNFIKEKVDWIKEKLGFSTEAETKINEIQRKAKQEELQKGVRQFHGGANILMDTAGRDVLKQQIASSDLPGHATGGYTGNGGKYDPAGIVHRGEFVFSKAATSRLGVGFLSSLHSAKTAKAGMIAAGLASSVAMAQPISVEARPTIATVQPTQQTAQAAPMTVSININAQGGDANTIAKAVRQELEKVQQQQQARARSRLVGRG